MVKISAVTWGTFDEGESKTILKGEQVRADLRIEPGDLLMSRANTLELVGASVVVGGISKNLQLSDKVLRLRLAAPLEKWASFFLNSQAGRAQIESMATGAQLSMRNISQGNIRRIRVPLPPFAEQRRIVEKIETLFARLDKGEEALRAVQRLLARYRQSLLKAAVTGELTAEWRAQNAGRLEHGRDLLARILQTRRETWTGRGKYREPAAPDTTHLPELPEGWVWASVGQLVSKIEAGKNVRCDERPPGLGEAGIVKISAVTWDEFNENESKTILSSTQINSSYVINSGDLLISRANTLELVGASVVVKRISKKLQISDKVLRLRCVFPLEHWVNYCLRSLIGRAQIEKLATGAQMSMRNISQKNLERIAVPLPPLLEAKFAAEQIVRIRGQCDLATLQTGSELARSAALRQSILKDAFAGRLVPQDPTDEPAADLLARIRADRAAAPTRTRRKASA